MREEEWVIAQEKGIHDLLRSAMFPVRDSEGNRNLVRLEDILCSNERYSISHPRDDYEFAFEELAIALTQCLLSPKSDDDIRENFRRPLSREEYRSAVDRFEFKDMFSVDDERYPFMQMLTTEETGEHEPFEIRSLIAGLPGDSSATLFNAPDEIDALCPSCAAITAFNLGRFPLGGAGYIYGIRGGAPLTALVNNSGEKDLRKSIWMNILSGEHRLLSDSEDYENAPVWVKPFLTGERGQTVSYNVGILRGLFWQSIKIRLHWRNEPGICDCCGQRSDKIVDGYYKRPATFRHGDACWIHPYTPYKVNEKTGKIYPVQSKSDVPLWNLLGDIFPPKNGSWPVNVENYARVFRNFSDHISLSIGGYQNDNAKIESRRFEKYSLANGWSANVGNIIEVTSIGRKALELLGKSVAYFVNRSGFDNNAKNGFHERARRMFFASTEDLIRKCIVDSIEKPIEEISAELEKDLSAIAHHILDELSKPYKNRIATWPAVALTKRYMSNLFTPKFFHPDPKEKEKKSSEKQKSGKRE